LLKGASLVGVFWGEFAKREPKANMAAMSEMIGWLGVENQAPYFCRYALNETANALNDIAARKVTGKVVIQPER
jgi:NADPH2:quinone reductase